ncbi:OmpA family protein [Halopseudomonas nanhaiensis]|nr:OmpA family protein [Halopseudomonas nanhaiensis]UAX00025.1 OmpA family protein [Halopseudomonas nanhaiensis]
MKLKNTVGLVVGAVISASAMPVMAQYGMGGGEVSRAGSVEAEAFAERYFTDDSVHDLSHGTLVGGGLGYFLSDDVSLNLGLGKYRNLDSDVTGEDIDGRLATLKAVYHFGEGAVRPYISGGVGHQELDQWDRDGRDKTTMLTAGAGVKNYLNENFFVRAGVDVLHGLDHSNTEWMAGVGLGLNFGSSTAPVAQAAPEPAPAPAPAPAPEPEMQNVRVELDVKFDFDKATIRQEYRDDIRSLAEFMKTYPDVSTSVAGHTDSIGSDQYNQKLSEERAKSVRQALIEEGVDGSRLEAVGYGEARPIADNDTEEGRQMNRRVEADVETEVEVR